MATEARDHIRKAVARSTLGGGVDARFGPPASVWAIDVARQICLDRYMLSTAY